MGHIALDLLLMFVTQWSAYTSLRPAARYPFLVRALSPLQYRLLQVTLVGFESAVTPSWVSSFVFGDCIFRARHTDRRVAGPSRQGRQNRVQLERLPSAFVKLFENSPIRVSVQTLISRQTPALSAWQG